MSERSVWRYAALGLVGGMVLYGTTIWADPLSYVGSGQGLLRQFDRGGATTQYPVVDTRVRRYVRFLAADRAAPGLRAPHHTRRTPVAIFDADGTLWRGVDFGDHCWRELRKRQMLHDMHSADQMMKAWNGGEGRVAPAEYWAYQATSMKGLPVDDVEHVALEVYGRDVHPFVLAPMVALVGELREAGVRVAVNSATNTHVLRLGLERDFGIPLDDIFGMDVKIREENGAPTFTDELQRLTYAEGKVKTLHDIRGRDHRVVLAVGDSAVNDAPFILESIRRDGAFGVFINLDRAAKALVCDRVVQTSPRLADRIVFQELGEEHTLEALGR